MVVRTLLHTCCGPQCHLVGMQGNETDHLLQITFSEKQIYFLFNFTSQYQTTAKATAATVTTNIITTVRIDVVT